MGPHNYEAIAAVLAERGLVAPDRRQESAAVMAEHMERHLVMIWDADDVAGVCPGLTAEQAGDLLRHKDLPGTLCVAFVEAVEVFARQRHEEAALEDRGDGDGGSPPVGFRP